MAQFLLSLYHDQLEERMSKDKVIYGKGIVDLHYPKKIRKGSRDNVSMIWRCPYFERWRGVIRRCYSSIQLKRNPKYIGCKVCEEWLVFSNFKAWMEKQDWEGKELDKDLLTPNNKLYSPETCIWVPHNINIFICDRKETSGINTVGTTLDKDTGLYRAQCSNPFGNTRYERRGYIGLFKTRELAHQAWRTKKHEYACKLAELQVDPFIKQALLTRYL